MAEIEIIAADGTRSRRVLRKKSALLVGTRDSNDIKVGGTDAQPMHCRIAWQQNAWRITAVTLDGVEINGRPAEQAELVAGDVVRVGDTRLVFHEAGGDPAAAGAEPAPDVETYPLAPPVPVLTPELKPITADQIPLAGILGDAATRERVEKQARSAKPDAKDKPPAIPARPLDRVLDTVDAPKVDPVEALLNGPPDGSSGRAGTTRKSARRPIRPGEEDLLRSPIVLGLGTLAALLLAGSITLYFWTAQARRAQALEAAQAAYDSAQFSTAVDLWEAFVKDYPGGADTAIVLQKVARARVERFLAGAAPDWKRGTDALEELIANYKDTPEFRDVKGDLREYVVKTSGRIAIGAGQAAAKLRRAAELDIAHAAARLTELWSSAESPPTELLQEIDTTLKQARAALTEQSQIDALYQRIDEAIAASQLNSAADSYRELTQRFPAAVPLRPTQTRFNSLRSLTEKLTVKSAWPEAEPPAPAAGSRPVSVWLGRRQRLRSDETSTGSGVAGWAGDTLFRLDDVTGDVVWRQPLGGDPPFFPTPIPGRELSWLVYSTRQQRLIQLRAATGEQRWSHSVSDRPIGVPLHVEGQLYVATTGGRLWQFDAETGEAPGGYSFGLELASPPVLASGDRLVVPADRGLLYILNRRPLGLAGVHWLGHGPGSIRTAPLVVRDYVVIAENLAPEKGRIRLLKLDPKSTAIKEIASLATEGEIRQTPVLRGKELYVPLYPEGILAVTLAETDSANALTRRALYRPAQPHFGPVSILPGPDDQVWMSGSAIRRLILGQSSLEAAKPELGLGRASQPAVHHDDALFVGRQPPHSEAVLFGKVDRRQMVGQWQITLGGGFTAVSPPQPDGALVVVNAAGEQFRVGSAKLTGGGTDIQGTSPLPIPEGLATPLLGTTLADGKLAVVCGLPKPTLWLVNPESGAASEAALAEPPTAAPISLAAGLLVPQPGKLSLLRPTGEKAGDEWMAPLDTTAPLLCQTLIRLSEGDAAALFSDGTLARFEVRAQPLTHVARVTERSAFVADGSLVAHDGEGLSVFTRTNSLARLDSRTLETLAERALEPDPAALRDGPWAAGDLVLVSPALGKLRGYRMTAELPLAWEIDIPGGRPAGPPLPLGNRLLLVTRGGHALTLSAETGAVEKSVDLGQDILVGPFPAGGSRHVAGARDGSLIVLPAE